MPTAWDNPNYGFNAPSPHFVKVTPADGADLPEGACRALWVGAAGAADLVDASGVAVTAFPLQVGLNPIGVKRVKSTGLVASNIWALY